MRKSVRLAVIGGAAITAQVVGIAPSFAGPTQPPTTWGCAVGRPNNYSGLTFCQALPSGKRVRVAIYCYEGVRGTHFYVYGPWVYKSGAQSSTDCGSQHDVAEMVYASTT